MGCVLTAGQGQAPARQASIKAGLPVSVASTTINKMCGSGMKAIMSGYDMIKAGSVDIVVAGGMESMGNAPYLLPKYDRVLKPVIPRYWIIFFLMDWKIRNISV